MGSDKILNPFTIITLHNTRIFDVTSLKSPRSRGDLDYFPWNDYILLSKTNQYFIA